MTLLQAQIAEVASANGENKDEEMENIISSELVSKNQSHVLMLDPSMIYDKVDHSGIKPHLQNQDDLEGGGKECLSGIFIQEN